MNRPRILHLRASNFVGGPESQLLRYADADRNGPWEMVFGVYVGEYEGREFRDAIQSRGLDVVSLRMGSLVASVRELVQVVRDKKIGLICAHGYKADIVAVIAGRICGIPVACFLRGWTRENRRVRLYEVLDRFFLRFAPRIVCLSKSQAKRVSGQPFLPARIRIVTNAIDASPVAPGAQHAAREELLRRFALPAESVLVATAGRLSPEKGVGDFLEAAALVNKQVPNARFLIFGSGALQDELEKKAGALGLQNHVTFAGFAQDLRSVLPGIDVLVNPSHSEVMPNVVMEGMAAAVPVVATAVGGVEEIAGPDRTVRLVSAGEPEEQALAIIELLEHRDQALALAAAGHERIAQAYSVETQREQFHAMYREFLPSVPAPQVASRAEGELPFLSVVLPVRNEQAHIQGVLAQLEAQEYPRDRFEVIAAVGTSTDRTAEVIQEFAERSTMSIRRFDNPSKLSSAGRNIGARHARGEYIIYVDGHCHIPSNTLLRDAASLFEQTGADCFCRPQPLTMNGNSLFQNAVAQARATSLGHGRDSTIFATDYEGPVDPSSSGAMYRRGVFERIGYYDESFDACEDVEFNYRVFKAGLVSHISPRLTILYQPRNTVRRLWQQMLRYGRGRFRLIEKHPDAFSLSQVVPAAFVLWIVFGGLASLISRPFSLAFASSLGVYAAVVLAFSVVLGFRHGASNLLMAPIIYPTIHLGLGAGFLAEALKLGGHKSGSHPKVSAAATEKPTPPSSVRT
jgi:succinoglycan biosynthesis protein ExoA